MDRGVAVGLTIVAGSFIALQAPINSMLGKTIGSVAAATVSFVVGTVVLVAITLMFAGGFGDVGETRSLPWYYLTGGLLGAVYVTTALVAVRSLGAGGVTVATITGQLTASVLIDHFGLLGLEKHALSWSRVIGVALLACGVYLIVRD